MHVAWISTGIFCAFVALPENSTANGTGEGPIDGFKLNVAASAAGSNNLQLHFQTSVDRSCAKTVMGASWFIESWMTCVMQCTCRFGDLCRHVVFNSLTMKCTVADPLADSQGGELTLSPGDIIYSQQDAVPVCSATEGYVLHQKCGAAVCVQLPTSSFSFVSADIHCQSRKGILYTIATIERYLALKSFLASRQVTKKELWVGLRRIFGSFYWSNGELLTQQQYDYIWEGLEPNHAGPNENCASTELFPITDSLYFRDSNCGEGRRFVCEQTLF